MCKTSLIVILDPLLLKTEMLHDALAGILSSYFSMLMTFDQDLSLNPDTSYLAQKEANTVVIMSSTCMVGIPLFQCM